MLVTCYLVIIRLPFVGCLVFTRLPVELLLNVGVIIVCIYCRFLYCGLFIVVLLSFASDFTGAVFCWWLLFIYVV